MRYIPELDGMRGVAILIVIASHFGAGGFIPGNFGVTLFFFISGFLITSLLADEADGYPISIRNFYIRRFLRLAPALTCLMVVTTAGYFMVTSSIEWREVSAGLFYYTNYYMNFGGPEPMPFAPLWSLAVEEHFYFIYPLIFAMFYKRDPRRFLSGVMAALVAVLTWRCILVFGFRFTESYTLHATDTRIDSILYGAALALLIRIKSPTLYLLESPIGIFGAIILLLLTFVIRNADFRETFRYTQQGLSLLPLIYCGLFSKPDRLLRAALRWPALVWIGKISYSLYLWHLSVSYFAQHLVGASKLAFVPTALVATFLISTLSYTFVERPFQRLRSYFRYREQRSPVLKEGDQSTGGLLPLRAAGSDF